MTLDEVIVVVAASMFVVLCIKVYHRKKKEKAQAEADANEKERKEREEASRRPRFHFEEDACWIEYSSDIPYHVAQAHFDKLNKIPLYPPAPVPEKKIIKAPIEKPIDPWAEYLVSRKSEEKILTK